MNLRKARAPQSRYSPGVHLIKKRKLDEIPNGSGVRLGFACPSISNSKADDELMKLLHKMMYGTPGQRSNRKRMVCGWTGTAEGETGPLELELSKMKKADVFGIATLLSLRLPKSATRERAEEEVARFLSKPTDDTPQSFTGAPVISGGGGRGRKPKATGGEGKETQPAKTKKQKPKPKSRVIDDDLDEEEEGVQEKQGEGGEGKGVILKKREAEREEDAEATEDEDEEERDEPPPPPVAPIGAIIWFAEVWNNGKKEEDGPFSLRERACDFIAEVLKNQSLSIEEEAVSELFKGNVDWIADNREIDDPQAASASVYGMQVK
uniref:Uncharacterized protein n=1 Tax=Chromera velia CCMP2878 TaxID=1169474 RepID=A0A0G4FBR9_9ALVE|eukprot:Cvel_16215.t1-p1 / transcript=Cvel_16215.t1 / gene=Cvel_16215 / organism=Chromera_velia_CCMP2878 / gene_product=hypothetical protein / transcript_product=hypothetical protein / location=Cvel_scaffold1239:32584-33546(-) / protein_length=321 / sequence_SO=supercontig / SO=protein_coding / is_pseudo=false